MAKTIMRETVLHMLEPIYDETSRILLLGSMPSPKSREAMCYYGHPQNRFWRVLAALWNEDVPQSVLARETFLLKHHIAVWDVLASCDIHGADDASITTPVPNDINLILKKAPIRAIFATGGAAGRYYNKLCLPQTQREIIVLPSTSAANCRRYNLEKLIESYRVLLPYFD